MALGELNPLNVHYVEIARVFRKRESDHIRDLPPAAVNRVTQAVLTSFLVAALIGRFTVFHGRITLWFCQRSDLRFPQSVS